MYLRNVWPLKTKIEKMRCENHFFTKSHFPPDRGGWDDLNVDVEEEEEVEGIS